MKYEMIFGDEALFDGAPDDAEYAGWFCQETRWYMILNGKILFSDGGTWCTSDNPYLSADIAAMRRIIKTPAWTVEDKALGIYPPVGISALLSGIGTCEVIGIDEKHEQVAIKYQDGSFDIVGCAELTPIETPEQLASALRDIWVSRVCEDTCYHHTGDAEVIRSIGMIYDALLSGELKTPEST